MYAERRRAFEIRIKELLGDHLRAMGQRSFKKAFVQDLTPRLLSALEDSFQMGLRDSDLAKSMDAAAYEAIGAPAAPGDENRG